MTSRTEWPELRNVCKQRSRSRPSHRILTQFFANTFHVSIACVYLSRSAHCSPLFCTLLTKFTSFIRRCAFQHLNSAKRLYREVKRGRQWESSIWVKTKRMIRAQAKAHATHVPAEVTRPQWRTFAASGDSSLAAPVRLARALEQCLVQPRLARITSIRRVKGWETLDKHRVPGAVAQTGDSNISAVLKKVITSPSCVRASFFRENTLGFICLLYKF